LPSVVELDRLNALQRRALEALRKHFFRNGYVRRGPDPKHRATHRGYELRFSALSARELELLLGHLRRLEIAAGKPFAKGPSWRIPIYGREQTSQLLAALHGSSAAADAAGR
jgi:hypothetical protein